ncbi:MAG: response regulator [Actinobacteria bacterium]|nr:MAG: response regulator [Actinomycetota bacterium]
MPEPPARDVGDRTPRGHAARRGLPRGQARRYDSPRTTASGGSRESSSRLRVAMADEPQTNILVVDDRPANLRTIEATLEPLKQRLVCVGSGTEALDQLLRETFACVLLDVQMPGMDGFETARYIKGRPRTAETPIIFITAVGDQRHQVFRGYSVGAVDYVIKPFEAEVLRAKVKAFVELHRTSVQLQRRTEELKRSNEALEQFAYIASHDLSEPLNTIAGFTGLLSQRYGAQLDDQGREFVEHIGTATGRMQTLIRDLLGYSRAGGPAAAAEPVDLNEVLDHVRHALHATIERKGAKVSVRKLPTVPGDRDRLGQLFQNLVSNAIKYCSDKAPQVEVQAARENGGWRLSVQDNGVGVDPSDRTRIFDMFTRVGPAGAEEGTGIGLATCRRIVEAHGGRIWVDDAKRDGCRFCIFLPDRQPGGVD